MVNCEILKIALQRYGESATRPACRSLRRFSAKRYSTSPTWCWWTPCKRLRPDYLILWAIGPILTPEQSTYGVPQGNPCAILTRTYFLGLLLICLSGLISSIMFLFLLFCARLLAGHPAQRDEWSRACGIARPTCPDAIGKGCFLLGARQSILFAKRGVSCPLWASETGLRAAWNYKFLS